MMYTYFEEYMSATYACLHTSTCMGVFEIIPLIQKEWNVVNKMFIQN